MFEHDTVDSGWMTLIVEYLRDRLLPKDGKEGWKVRRKHLDSGCHWKASCTDDHTQDPTCGA